MNSFELRDSLKPASDPSSKEGNFTDFNSLEPASHTTRLCYIYIGNSRNCIVGGEYGSPSFPFRDRRSELVVFCATESTANRSCARRHAHACTLHRIRNGQRSSRL